MEHEVVNQLQNLQLTKVEEEDTLIANMSRPDLIEECSLNLFGHLLTERHQNLQALKNTLRVAWKMGSDLRIIEVGNNILQFKFNSMFQLEWVERSGPWNFENNLLLLCRWKKGMTLTNILFSHSPFWVQVWGPPFELMSEEVGKNIGGKLGEVLEVDKCSLQIDQAKFIRIKVDLPIDKPLRKGGYINMEDGGRCWITFKYEQLPTFCFICGRLGHDNKHYLKGAIEQQQLRQYGDWLRAGGTTKSGSDKAKTTSHRSWESMESEDARSKSQLGTKNIRSSIQTEERRSEGLSDVLNLNLIGEQNSGERMDAASPVALSNLNK